MDHRWVFVDATNFIRFGRSTNDPLYHRPVDLAQLELVSVITTDYSIEEIVRKHVENDLGHIGEVAKPHFRRLVESFFDIGLPDISREEIQERLAMSHLSQVRAQFSELSAKIVPVDAASVRRILNDYGRKTGFFAPGTKKNQFPDAIIFDALSLALAANDQLVIVSDDNDWRAAASLRPNTLVVGGLLELYRSLNISKVALDASRILQRHMEEIIVLANKEIQNQGLWVRDVEDGEIYGTEVTDVVLDDLSAFESIDGSDEVLVTGTLTMTVDLEFSHPNWENAMYDSEDKVLIPFESVEGERAVVITASFSMTFHDDGDASFMPQMTFSFGDDFDYGIDLDDSLSDYR